MKHNIPPISPNDSVSITDKFICVTSTEGKQLYDINKYKLPENLYGEKYINLETSIYNLTANVLNFCQTNHVGIGEFEKNLGVSYGYFSRIRKTMNPSLEIIVKVANTLGLTFAELFDSTWNSLKPTNK